MYLIQFTQQARKSFRIRSFINRFTAGNAEKTLAKNAVEIKYRNSNKIILKPIKQLTVDKI